ncbi:MAG: outer membrane beta-barrel protein [Verrucomicrobiota bacterium]
MKLKKWTLGLAALGLVSLAPGAQAQSTNAPAAAPAPAPIPINTALSATSLSGYVDTSAVWVPGTGNAHPAPVAFNTPAKQDGFNLDSADVKIARPPDTGKWGAGYTFEAQYGPDAINPFAGSPIRQAYVEMTVPIGNGLDLEMGQWDNIIGYESNDDYKNPNWSRSYGYSMEPVSHTGILATYKFSDAFSAQVGVADSLTSGGNITAGSVGGAESKKAIVSLLSLTAPDSWGSFKGSSFYVGFDDGPGLISSDRQHLYVGATLNTPVKGLTFGAAYDSVWNNDIGTVALAGVEGGYASAVSGYSTYALTDKASLNARVEFAHGGVTAPGAQELLAFTGTFQYQLWNNVISRLEARWDHSGRGDIFGGEIGALPDERNQVLLAANVIYKF